MMVIHRGIRTKVWIMAEGFLPKREMDLRTMYEQGDCLGFLPIFKSKAAARRNGITDDNFIELEGIEEANK